MRIPRAMSGPRPTGGTAAVALVMAVAACESVTAPSADLSGTWTFSYATAIAQVCGPSAPGALRATCSGGGQLTLIQSGPRIRGDVPMFGGCISCGSATEFLPRVAQPVLGDLEGTRLTLSMVNCRFSGTVAGQDVRQVSGNAECVYDDVRTEGTWRMTRTE